MVKSGIYTNGQDDEAKLVYSVGFLWGKISSQIDGVLSKVGLNTAKFNILMVIKHVGKDDGIQQNAISKELLVSASNITKMLDKLEGEELITRNSKAGDRRVRTVKITPKGSKMLDFIWLDYIKLIHKISPKQPNINIKQLINELSEWNQSITKSNELE